MVQAADFGKLHDLPRRGELDRPEVGCVLIEREVCARLVVVGEIAGQDAVEVSLAENEHVIQTLAPGRADNPLRERVLPRAVRGREDLTNPYALHALPEGIAGDRVAIAEEVGGCGIVREGLHDLLSRLGGGGMFRHVEVEDTPAMVAEDDQDEEHAQASGGDREEIDGDQVADMVGQERPPGLRGWGRRFGMSRETVRSAMSMPSFRSSPWILGTPRGDSPQPCGGRGL